MNSLRRSRRPAAGFTLLELLIAMAVLLVGLLALWQLHGATLLADANAHRLGMSTLLAQDAMEKLMSETFVSRDQYINPDIDPAGALGCGSDFPNADGDGLDNLPCGVDGVDVRVNSLGSTDPALGAAMFLRTYHVEFVPGETDRIVISVRVTYDEALTGKRHGVTIASTRSVDRYDPMGLAGDSG
jgi:prepilin-type N-terminal cleavage/methylation domain-containing protein